MDEVCTHWKRLMFYDDGFMKDGKLNISILTKWKVIKGIFLKENDNVKLYIKEQLRNISYLETINLKPSSQLVKTKYVPKKVKHTPSDNSTMWSPSYFKHVDNFFPHSPTPKSQKVFSKELALANHLFHRLHQKFHSLTRYPCLLFTNTLNGSSMLRVTIIVVLGLFLHYSVKEKRITHFSTINLSKS